MVFRNSLAQLFFWASFLSVKIEERILKVRQEKLLLKNLSLQVRVAGCNIFLEGKSRDFFFLQRINIKS